MKKTCIMLGLMIGLTSHMSYAETKDHLNDYFFDVVKKEKSIKVKASKDVQSYKSAEYFKTMLNGPMTPAFKFNDGMGVGYIYGLCEAHNCGSNNMDVVYFTKNKKVKTVTYENCQQVYSPAWTTEEKRWYQKIIKDNSTSFARCDESVTP